MLRSRCSLSFSLALLGGFFICFFFLSTPAQAATFTVNSNVDDNDGTCNHPYVNAATDCTWREAINAADAAVGADNITFEIDPSFPSDGDGQWTILLDGSTNPLTGPTIVRAVGMWDGDDDRPGIKFKRAASTGTLVNFTSGAAGSKLQGIEIEGSDTGVAATVTNVTIGTDCDGASDAHERNVIYGTYTQAVYLSSTGAKVRGNYLGVRADGVTASTFGSQAVRIVAAGADNNLIGYQEGTSATCAPALQRNVIGGGDNDTDNGILIASQSTSNISGAAASAPDHNTVAGNYLGVGVDGITDIGGTGSGLTIGYAATLNTIGTDGDGVDDTLEGNVISGWTLYGVFIEGTGYNHLAGNLVGFLADGLSGLGNGNHGILMRGYGNIAGWCDTTVDASLCFNGGTAANQANVSGFNGITGIRVGASCNDCRVAGNYVGTDAGQTVDAGNGEEGIAVHRGDLRVIIGGTSAEQGNVVAYNNEHGIHIDGYEHGTPFTSGATEDYVVRYNVVYSNAMGIHLYGTEQDGTVDDADGVVSDNTITDNDNEGILCAGSSPDITNNTISDNGTFGIALHASYREDEPTATGTNYNNPYDTLSPNNAANDSVSKPTISGNTINNNTSGGILMLDAQASNAATLGDDNTIGNNGDTDVRQDWYAAVELLDRYGESILTDLRELTFTPNAVACTGVCEGIAFVSVGEEEGIWGPTGIVYDDTTTWFQLTDYRTDASGTRVDYNPYEVSYSAANRLDGETEVTIDGDGSNDVDSGYLPNGVETVGLTRYQIAEIGGYRRPSLAPAGIESPLALSAVAVSDTVIRWYFDDLSVNESGFRVISIVDNSDVPMAEAAMDAEYIEESGLTAATEYCDRYVYAFNDDGTSDAVLLPCVTTLESGEEALEVGIPKLRLHQTVSFADGLQARAAGSLADRLLISFVPLGAFVSMGVLKARRRQRKGKPHRFVFAAFFTVGVLLTVGVFAHLLGVSCPPVKACDSESLPEGTVLEQFDELQFSFLLTNDGDAPGKAIVFTDVLPPETTMVVRERSIVTLLDGLPMVTDAQWEDSVLNVQLGDVAPAQQVRVTFVGRIETKTGALRNDAYVEASDAVRTTSNEVSFVINTPPPVLPAPIGSLARSKDNSAVYYIADDYTRRPFPDPVTFDSWYPDGAKIYFVSAEALAVLPVGRPVLPRPGTWLIKSPISPIVYAVERGNVLRAVPSETRAAQLYGEDWARQILDRSDGLLHHYAIGEPLDFDELPSSLVITDSQTICYVDRGQFCRQISPAGFTTNRFSNAFVRRVSSAQLSVLYVIEPIGRQEEQLVQPD